MDGRAGLAFPDMSAQATAWSYNWVLTLDNVPFVCRRAIPLALALLNVSNPTLGAMDALSRLSHDTDAEVAQSSVLALGACPAPTNTSPQTRHLLSECTVGCSADAAHAPGLLCCRRFLRLHNGQHMLGSSHVCHTIGAEVVGEQFCRSACMALELSVVHVPCHRARLICTAQCRG